MKTITNKYEEHLKTKQAEKDEFTSLFIGKQINCENCKSVFEIEGKDFKYFFADFGCNTHRTTDGTFYDFSCSCPLCRHGIVSRVIKNKSV